jgi:hypothetical protein
VKSTLHNKKEKEKKNIHNKHGFEIFFSLYIGNLKKIQLVFLILLSFLLSFL